MEDGTKAAGKAVASAVHSVVASHRDAAEYTDPLSKHYDKECIPATAQSLVGATLEYFLLISEAGMGSVGLAQLGEEKIKPDDEGAARRKARTYTAGYILFGYWSKCGAGILQEVQKGGTGGSDVNYRIRQAAKQQYVQIWDDLAKDRKRHAQNADDFLGGSVVDPIVVGSIVVAIGGKLSYPRPHAELTKASTIETAWRLEPVATQVIQFLPYWKLQAAYTVVKYGAIASKLLDEFAPTFRPLATHLAPMLDRNMSVAQKEHGLFRGKSQSQSTVDLGHLRGLDPLAAPLWSCLSFALAQPVFIHHRRSAPLLPGCDEVD